MDSRKRLYHWLKGKVEAGEYGLKWLDKDNQIFSIPWMHQSNQNWTEDKGQIFKEWAVFTERYQEGENHYSHWKTNIRVALYRQKSCFQELPDLHDLKNEFYPYKAYRFVTNETTEGNQTDIQNSPQCISESTDTYPLSNQQNENVNIAGSTEPPPSQYGARSPIFDALSSPTQNESASFGQDLLFEQQGKISKQPVVFHNPSPSHPDNDNLQSSNSPESSMDTNSCGFPSDLHSVPSSDLMSTSKLPSNEMAEIKADLDSMFYKIYYHGGVVKEGEISCRGAHVNFGTLSNFLTALTDQEREKIELPECTDTPVAKQMTYKQQDSIRDVLSKFKRGFLLKCHEGNIYVKRMCQVRLFAKTFNNGNLSIERTTPGEIKLFDLNDFNASKAKSPVILLSVGQELNPFDTVKNLSISMEIMPVKIFMDMAPSEIQEFKIQNFAKKNFQYSLPDTNDKYLDQMKNLNLFA